MIEDLPFHQFYLTMQSDKIEKGNKARVRILLIDDDKNFLFAMTRILLKANFDVSSVNDSK